MFKLTTIIAAVVLSPTLALAQPLSPSDAEDCCDTDNDTTETEKPADPYLPATTPAAKEPTAAPAPTSTTPNYYHHTEQDFDAHAADVSAESSGDNIERKMQHGFRVGWGYIMNIDEPVGDTGESLKEKYDLKSASSLILGYEAFYRLVGHSWLNVIFVGNISIAGVEQSKFIPNANGLIGFEFDESFQLGVGVNLVPVDDKPAHMIAAAGWTPKVGEFSMPIHFYFIPDVDNNHRIGSTIGVNW
jgi:hypothetical protein